MEKNYDIIEFLIECIVISKLNDNKNRTIENNHSLKNKLHFGKKVLDLKLDKLTDIKLMENEYTNYNIIFSNYLE